MNERYICYCGLYCGNCAVKAKIQPSAKILYNDMKAAGFENFVHLVPGGNDFWPFLKDLAENGTCISCKDGSGDPGCAVRICAKDSGVEICALCEDYPCRYFDELLESHPILRQDNAFLRENGLEAWAKLQDERQAKGIMHQDVKIIQPDEKR